MHGGAGGSIFDVCEAPRCERQARDVSLRRLVSARDVAPQRSSLRRSVPTGR